MNDLEVNFSEVINMIKTRPGIDRMKLIKIVNLSQHC